MVEILEIMHNQRLHRTNFGVNRHENTNGSRSDSKIPSISTLLHLSLSAVKGYLQQTHIEAWPVSIAVN